MNDSPVQAIEMRKVIKTFKSTAGEFQVLKGIDLTLQQGEFVSIIGKSGSGKSTLLNMITGIDHPSQGQVVVGGVDVYKMNESQRSLWRGKNLGIVFQFFQLLPMLNLLENTMLPMDYCNMYPTAERPKRALELLKLVGLENQAYKLPNAVSTGQQQSAAIARALATDPPFIVADEPTGNLDSRSADVIIQLFDHLRAAGKTIAMVTHDPSLTERTTRTVIISDGELVDEVVVRALPLLEHRQMLQVSKQIERFTFQRGATILGRDQHVDYFFIVAKGRVEVVVQSKRCPETIVARLNPGEFFGEVELVKGGNSIASIRCSNEGPVELAAIHRSVFLELLKNSTLTEEAIVRVVNARVDENRSSDRSCR
jgi:ABC-type lipoprotein export system ATPase subunit